MKTKTIELTGSALDWAVAKCEYDELAAKNIQYPEYAKHYPKISPSTNWSQGGPIIEREKMNIFWVEYDSHWYVEMSLSEANADETYHVAVGPTPLIAAMRCYVASKLGEEINIPEELQD